MRLNTTIPLPVGALALLACAEPSPTPPTDISVSARQYLRDAIDTLELHSWRRHDTDWTAVRERAFMLAGTAQDRRETYDAIEATLHEHDRHTIFFRPGEIEAAQSGPKPPPGAVRVNAVVNYLNVPGFVGYGPAAESLATRYQELVAGVDTNATCGWIIDLRENRGGNMWPILAGLTSLVGADTVGAFAYPDSSRETWITGPGWAAIDTLVLARSQHVHTLANPQPALAVLLGNATASTGEAMAIVFRGRRDTRFFGDSTSGLSTGTRGFGLHDSAVMVFPVAVMSDREGVNYGGSVRPDSLIPQNSSPHSADATVAAASDWLQQTDPCRNP